MVIHFHASINEMRLHGSKFTVSGSDLGGGTDPMEVGGRFYCTRLDGIRVGAGGLAAPADG